jgi:hypothetical protein
LQAISIRHCDRFWKVEKDIFTVVGRQADATATARVEIECQRVGRLFLRPMSGRAVKGSSVWDVATLDGNSGMRTRVADACVFANGSQ